MAITNTIRIYETLAIVNEAGFTGGLVRSMQVITGSRMLVSLTVLALSGGGSVSLDVNNKFSESDIPATIASLNLSAVGKQQIVVSDFHNVFDFDLNVTGTATVMVGVSMYDNAGVSHINNPTINVDVDHVQGDSVRIGDGVRQANVTTANELKVNTVQLPTSLGQKTGANSTSVILASDQPALPLSSGAATEAKQDVGNTKLDTLHADNLVTQGKIDSTNTKLDTLHTDNVSTNTKIDSTNTKLDTVNTKLDTLHADNVSTNTKIDSTNTKLDTVNTNLGTVHTDLVGMQSSLTSIDAGIPASLGQKPMATSMPVTIASDQSNLPSLIKGTSNGQTGGTEFVFVNNRKQQILDAHDRVETITTVDGGTKDERITQIDYTSPTIGAGAGYTARKSISYTLTSGKYVASSITWTLV